MNVLLGKQHLCTLENLIIKVLISDNMLRISKIKFKNEEERKDYTSI